MTRSRATLREVPQARCAGAVVLAVVVCSCQSAAPASHAGPIQPRPDRSARAPQPREVPQARVAAATSASSSAVVRSEPEADAGVDAGLEAQGPWIDLPIEGHEPAVVSLPLGARGRVPVVVAAQGLGDNPLWWCAWWRERIGDRGFVLCPRGRVWGRLPSGAMGYAYTSADELEREVLRGLEALAARYPASVDPGPVLFGGFSMGATLGATLVMRHPDRFPRAILVEGGNTEWNDRPAKAYANHGGQRILFGCGTEGCLRWAKFAKRRLDRAGVQTRIAQGEGGGHSYHDGPVSVALAEAFSWVLEGDARW